VTIPKTNPRFELFRHLFPQEHKSAYPGWIRKHSNDFRASRHIYSDHVPPDMQDEFTDWLRLQHMEVR
jgi:hypothetical protein